MDERHHGQWVADNAMKTEEREENSCRSATSDDTAVIVLLYKMAVFGFRQNLPGQSNLRC